MTDASVDGLVSGRYRLGDLLGTGGSASVFAAIEISTGLPVALKILHPHLSGSMGARTAFFAEARTAAELKHPNVIRVLGQGEHAPVGGSDESQAWIALALVPGMSLADWIGERGPLAVSDALAVARGVLQALIAAHAIGLIHRDVSPANIMVAFRADGSLSEDAVVLLDFGLADAAGRTTVSASVLLDVASSGGGDPEALGVLGTVDYLSPEQARGMAVDARGDVYQVGGVLYFALTAQPPFVRQSAAAVLRAHAQAPPPVPSVLRAGVSRQLDGIVVKALLKDPGSRFPSAASMLSAIEAVTATAGPSTVTVGSVSSVIDGPNSRADAKTRILAPQAFLQACADTTVPFRPTLPMHATDVSQSAHPPQSRGRRRPVGAGWLAGVLVTMAFGGGWVLAAQGAADSSGSIGTAPAAVAAASPEQQSAAPVDAAASLPVLVPELRNLNLMAATAALQAAGLPLGTLTIENSPSPGDTVLHISPAAGTRLPTGQVVNLTVASGSNVIPAVRELTQVDATRTLRAAGFATQVALRTSETQPAGLVMGSDPGDGVVHRVSDVVTLLLSTGPAAPTPTGTPAPTMTSSATPRPAATQTPTDLPTAPPAAPPAAPPTVATAVTRPAA